jgi:Ca2+-binding EF-hand superfamily protein
LDGDGRITRDDLLQMFKAYFEISMELVRGSVKLIEEGMLEQFDDQDNKPVSAAFGAPTSLDTDSNHHTDLKDQPRLDLGSPNDFLFTRYEPTFNISPTKTLDLRPSLAFLGENDHVPVIENISQDAINEMIQIIFDQIENSHGEYLTLEDFIKAVDIDVNIIAW